MGRRSQGYAINVAGQVAGLFVPGYSHAFLYSAGTMNDLGTLGGNNSQGYGMNNAGVVTGYSNTKDGFQHAFLYSNAHMSDLGALDPRGSSRGLGANDAGQVTGDAGVVRARPLISL